ncbi:hypothetical protein BM1374166_00783 [Bartonella tribocorum]|nr:hypothetical protein BM1374166_00783 [Bartonella tribocorum]
MRLLQRGNGMQTQGFAILKEAVFRDDKSTSL